ncbi:hypothetical protein N7449_000096 [Penicillium cf. viridicatum]|uniref:Uncharacterized protein n=1 Tax=Penicillium cf. viridicatum TaxID=2972119 RepID=A0A9W9T7Z7_9EURO|nr:hypothetical protein N7449_000096 [Penicillium cf. viridicatum]
MTRNALHYTAQITYDSGTQLRANYARGAEESNNLVYTSMRRDITSPGATIIKGYRMLGAEQLYTNKQVQLGGKDKEKRG